MENRNAFKDHTIPLGKWHSEAGMERPRKAAPATAAQQHHCFNSSNAWSWW